MERFLIIFLAQMVAVLIAGFLWHKGYEYFVIGFLTAGLIGLTLRP